MNHLSELRVDKLLAGELADDAAVALRAHAAECARCGEALADAVAIRDEFATASAFRPAVAPRRSRWRAAAVIAPLSLAAAVALLLAWPAKPVEDRIRTKGSAALGWFVAHGGEVRRGLAHETVVPGDRLEFTTSTTAAGWFAAIGEDGHGARSVYAPLEAIEPGRERLAGGAVELDDALGHETVTGVFCAQLFDPSSIDLADLPAGCTADRLTLDKVPR